MFTCDKTSWSAYFYKFLPESNTMINQWFSSALWVAFTVFCPWSFLKKKVRIWTLVHKSQRVVSFKANIYLLPKRKKYFLGCTAFIKWMTKKYKMWKVTCIYIQKFLQIRNMKIWHFAVLVVILIILLFHAFLLKGMCISNS